MPTPTPAEEKALAFTESLIADLERRAATGTDEVPAWKLLRAAAAYRNGPLMVRFGRGA